MRYYLSYFLSYFFSYFQLSKLIFVISLFLSSFFASAQDQNANDSSVIQNEINIETENTTETIQTESELESLTPSPSIIESRKQNKSRHYANISFRERTIFKLYYFDDARTKEVLNRASKATKALEEAMSAETPLESKSKPASVIITPEKTIDVRVRGYRIIELTEPDFIASRFNTLDEYQESLQTELNIFVGDEFQRLQIQKVALQFFLSIFFALLGFLILRQTRAFFNNADSTIEEKKESLRPMTFMSETLISSQALGGLFALSLVIGRVIVYLIVIFSTAAAVLGQFSSTRNAMGELFSRIFTESISNIQSLIQFLPSLLLAVVLLFLWNLSIKILDLFLKGVRSGRIAWSYLKGYRISIVRFWGVAISSFVFFPLILASLFGGFNNPLEFIVLGGAIILCISVLPILISIAAGSYLLWFGQVYPGQWIRIGKTLGEITEVSLFRITVVPQEGGLIHIPMLKFLFYPFAEMRESHRRELRFKVQRIVNLEETIAQIEKLFPKKFNVQLQCLSLSSSEFHFALFTPSLQSDVRHEILCLISFAHDQKTISLTPDLIEEVAH